MGGHVAVLDDEESQAAELVLSAFQGLVETVRARIQGGQGYALSDTRSGAPLHVEAGLWISSPDDVPGAEEHEVVILFEAKPASSWLKLYLDVVPPPEREVAYCSIESSDGEWEDVLTPAVLPDKKVSQEQYRLELRAYGRSVVDYVSDRTSMILGHLHDRAREKLG